MPRLVDIQNSFIDLTFRQSSSLFHPNTFSTRFDNFSNFKDNARNLLIIVLCVLSVIATCARDD